MNLHKPARARILVIAPHMDDDVIGPGGTLALHRDLNSETDIVFCAAGADEQQDQVRRAESEQAAKFMRFRNVQWLGYPDGSLSLHEESLASEFGRIITTTRPELIFCPFPADHHRDHSAVTAALAKAVGATDWAGEVWCYEVWSPLWPNVAIDISAVVDEKRHAIGLYKSQIAGLHYVDGTIGLNRYRGLRVYVDYAETFLAVSANEFVDLVEETMNCL